MTTPTCRDCHDTGSREGYSEFAGQVYTYCRCEAGRALKARDDARPDWDRRQARTVTVRTNHGIYSHRQLGDHNVVVHIRPREEAS